MEPSAMFVQTAWQNALYINPIEYSNNFSLQEDDCICAQVHMNFIFIN